MDFVKLITDSYDRKARLYPALLVLLPPVITIYAFLNGEVEILESLLAIVAGTGGMYFLTQVARDNGKKKEPLLFQEWGGMPSVAIFRHRDNKLDAITKRRYHKIMTDLIPESPAITAQNEKRNSQKTDQTYFAWSNFLRIHTREKKKFPLIFAENVSYGYRRNIFGMRALGIWLCSLSMLACGLGNPAYLYFRYNQIFWQNPPDPLLLCSFFLASGLLLFWIFHVRKDWVKIPADAYAQRLVESIEEIAKTL